VVCLQAKLGYYNRDDNMLTRWFSLEYAQLFALLLQGLCRLRMPIPLGGTSNHFRMKVLRQMGEWDAYNVTEDADVGIRLARSGYRSAVLDSWTWEEAPNRLGVWLKQRSRWIKGYMQTWGVHMRRPTQLWRGLGGGGFIGFQLFFALSTLVYVVSPWLWAMACWVVWRDGAELFAQEMFSWRGIGCALVLVCGALVQWWGAWLAMHHAAWCRHGRRAQQWRMWCAVATYPLYGWLHACASMLAIWQFMVKPYYWEKTPHGLYKRAKMK
jgi:cellulose synthase/poly-beta-1,6-N-acetylglucosamine synthase-like glycosyltransferase